MGGKNSGKPPHYQLSSADPTRKAKLIQEKPLNYGTDGLVDEGSELIKESKRFTSLKPKEISMIEWIYKGKTQFEAGKLVGYAESTAKVAGCRLMRRPDAQIYLRELQEAHRMPYDSSPAARREKLGAIIADPHSSNTEIMKAMTMVNAMDAQYGQDLEGDLKTAHVGGNMDVPRLDTPLEDWAGVASMQQAQLMKDSIEDPGGSV